MVLTKEEKECIKDYIQSLSEKVKKQGCPKCKGEIESVKGRRFRCKKSCGEFILNPKIIKKVRDSYDSKNWKSTCEECGGIMDYHNFMYGCRKCGHVLRV